MFSYIILSGIMTLFGLLLATSIYRGQNMWSKNMLITMVSILALTAIFDSLIIGVGIVDYNPDLILGVFVGKAPVEDFLYTIVVVPLGIALWKFYDEK